MYKTCIGFGREIKCYAIGLQPMKRPLYIVLEVSRTVVYLLGFDVWFCLFVAVCSTVAAVCICVCFDCTVHMVHISAICVGQTHKRG